MAKKSENAGSTITIQYYRSSIGYAKKQKLVVSSLGITKLNQTVTRPTASVLVRTRVGCVERLSDGQPVDGVGTRDSWRCTAASMPTSQPTLCR
jgi:ribosomal protein L30/L7E